MGEKKLIADALAKERERIRREAHELRISLFSSSGEDQTDEQVAHLKSVDARAMQMFNLELLVHRYEIVLESTIHIPELA